MATTVSLPGVTATPAARSALAQLCAARGGPVMFVQSGGCCAGSVPMCFAAGEFLVGGHDLLLGEIDGCPFYIDEALYRAWNQGPLVLDVADGPPEGFSLGAGPGQHFVTRGTACAVPPVSKGRVDGHEDAPANRHSGTADGPPDERRRSRQ